VILPIKMRHAFFTTTFIHQHKTLKTHLKTSIIASYFFLAFFTMPL